MKIKSPMTDNEAVDVNIEVASSLMPYEPLKVIFTVNDVNNWFIVEGSDADMLDLAARIINAANERSKKRV